MILTVLQEGFLYGVLAMGSLMTFRVMGIADLSVDGSFPLGVCVSAVLMVNGWNPWLALMVSFTAGFCAGATTGLLHVRLKISSLLAGILVMTGLYSINLMIAGGKSNIPLFGVATLFGNRDAVFTVVVLALCAVAMKLAVDWLLSTRFGYLLKVTGDNEALVLTLGENANTVKILGLAFANGLVALSGGLAASYGRYFDISMGTGMAIMGLSSVLLGTLLLSKTRLKLTTQVIVGAMLYRLIVAMAIRMGLNPIHLKLVTVGIFIATILLTQNPLTPYLKRKEGDYARPKERTQNV